MEIEIWQLSAQRWYLKSSEWMRFTRAGKYRDGRAKGPGLNQTQSMSTFRGKKRNNCYKVHYKEWPVGRTSWQNTARKVGFLGLPPFCMAHWCYLALYISCIGVISLFVYWTLSVLRPLVSRDWGSVCPLEFPIAGTALDLEAIFHNVWQ